MSMVRGFATRSTAGTTAILAAPAAGKQYIIRSITVTIDTIIATGKVAIADDTTPRFKWDAITAGSGQPPQLRWGPEDGPIWTAAKAVNLITTGNCVVYVYVTAELRA